MKKIRDRYCVTFEEDGIEAEVKWWECRLGNPVRIIRQEKSISAMEMRGVKDLDFFPKMFDESSSGSSPDPSETTPEDSDASPEAS